MTEQPLPGNATAGIVRVGGTVRRPAGPWTGAVDALLEHLRAAGFTGCPRPLGRDSQGRQVLEFVEGEIGDATGVYTESELRSIGAMLADLHGALSGFTPPPGAAWQSLIPPDREELVCHNDVAPWNLVASPRGWVLIDWDAAAPSSRLWDLAYAAQAMAGLRAGRPIAESKPRLKTFLDGYGLDPDQRPRLVKLLGPRARAMHDLLRDGHERGIQPWARIWTEDGPYWLATAEYLDRWTASGTG